jgi:hypothetical protein
MTAWRRSIVARVFRARDEGTAAEVAFPTGGTQILFRPEEVRVGADRQDVVAGGREEGAARPLDLADVVVAGEQRPCGDVAMPPSSICGRSFGDRAELWGKMPDDILASIALLGGDVRPHRPRGLSRFVIVAPTKEVTMRRRVLFLTASLGVVAMLAIAAPALGEGRPFSTTLTGAAEVPGPGDPDASGTAFVSLNQGLGEVCFDLSWAGIDGTVTAAHIHVGAATVAGPVVVGLFAGTFEGTDSASGCISGVSEELIKAIRQDPENYYVNIHSSVFPAGAVRGQLGK